MPSKAPVSGRCGSLIRNWKLKYGQKMFCTQWPSKGRNRCGIHGGKSLRGVDSASFKDGAHTKTWPDAWYGISFEEALNSDELKQVRVDIAAIEVRISELRQMLKSPVGTGIVEQMEKAQEKIANSRNTQDIEESLAVINTCTDQIRRNAALWEEMAQYIDRKNRLIHSEHRRLMDTHESMSISQLLVLARQIVTILREEIRNKELGRRINERIRGLLPQQGKGPLN